MKHNRTAAITGGLHTGKSTVSRFFKELGSFVIDADKIARELVQPGTAVWARVVAHFGSSVLLPSGQIDRARLRNIIFNDTTERLALNNIMHPPIMDEIREREARIRAANEEVLLIVDAPLLIEVGLHREYSDIIVVCASEAFQLARLMQEPGISIAFARKQIAAQMPLSEKVALATYIINNDSNKRKFRRHVSVFLK